MSVTDAHGTTDTHGTAGAEAPTEPATDPVAATPEDFVERIFAAALGAQLIHAAYLGDRLGWYRALTEEGPLTAPELAGRTGCAERYAREWLEHQAVCGWITVDDASAPAAERRYTLPATHAEVLTDADSLAYLMPLAQFVGAVGTKLDTLVEAYRRGTGVSWAELGDVPRQAQAAMNRPLFTHLLGQEHLPAIPEVHAALSAGGRVADIGCGGGWSSIAIAKAYPDATVDGFDVDEPSVEMARRNAAAEGVSDRVRFRSVDAADLHREGPYDLVIAFECVHDMGDPVGVLGAMGALAGATGTVVVMDERAKDRFEAPGDELEQLFYGYSLTCCLPDCLSHEHSAATGTVMRPATLDGYARQAGFAGVEILPIEHDTFYYYRLNR